MTDFRQRCLLGLTGILLCFGAIGLSILWIEPADQGMAAISWPPAPAEILACRFRSEFDPEATSNSDYEVRNTSSRIAVAYAVETATGPRYFDTFHFDAFGPRVGDDGFMCGDAWEVRSSLRAGPDLQVHYDPEDPTTAVIQPGIPFYTSCLFIVPCTLLAFALGVFRLALRPRVPRLVEHDPDARPYDPTTTLLGAILLPFAAVTLILFLRPTFSLFTFRLPPWWILPGFYVLILLMLAMPRALRRWKPIQAVFGMI
ncbi:MAG: DUF3592 domain-containing protein, partial [Fuerstiella sp.]|nr:DUF3592 domain-containing protein [Fuerstiella sp.]